ncbi:hypothetical protein C2G38_2175642 [Gigaspora rosea]|uniref:Protein kinase domain-containing protein n=1 Tax=Gigaspora rosea TaxID=44941 RepID=A0A397VRM2_9GLOM|nr:hypothetical protein C2G38_2175642 [Gigaspora rosea]
MYESIKEKKDKLSLLIDILKDLIKIHKEGYIHCDLHCGIILQHEASWFDGSLKSDFADLGLSRKNEKYGLKTGIYRIMPYIAPEVLLGQKYTLASGFGVIMAEMQILRLILPGIKLSAGGHYHDNNPGGESNESDEFDESDEFNKPDESDISDKFDGFNELYRPNEYDQSDESNEKLQIINEFMAADKIIPELSITIREHSDIVYAIRFINTHDIA